MTISSKLEFDHKCADLAGQMVSGDLHTRIVAAQNGLDFLRDLPKFIRNSPHCEGEIEALKTFIRSII